MCGGCIIRDDIIIPLLCAKAASAEKIHESDSQ